LEGDQERAVAIRDLLLDTTGLLGSLNAEKEPLKTITVRFASESYSITLTKDLIVAVKHGQSGSAASNGNDDGGDDAGEQDKDEDEEEEDDEVVDEADAE